MNNQEQRMKEIMDEYNAACERISQAAYGCLDFGGMPNLSILYPAPQDDSLRLDGYVEGMVDSTAKVIE